MLTLGVDTSNYTTSLALVTPAGELIMEQRKLLEVKPGKKGLRQSEAFFQHVQNLETLMDSISPYQHQIANVVVSRRPRDVVDSYMPVFLAGIFFAKSFALGRGIEIKETNHQWGHILAGYYQNEEKLSTSFYMLQLSGGTTELHQLSLVEKTIRTTLVYESLDINFGQLLDRVGVAAGLSFPAGKEMDELARQVLTPRQKNIPAPAFKDQGMNLSGLENKFTKMLLDQPKEEVFQQLFEAVATSILRLKKDHCQNKPLLVVGGVSNSRYLRRRLAGQGIVFPTGNLGADNAVGVALHSYYLEAFS